MTKTVPVKAVGKPRQTRADAWKNRPPILRYRAMADELRLHMRHYEIPPAGLHIVFFLPMAKSWSKKKKLEMAGRPHQQKPDIDNLVKSVLDALMKEDKEIYDIRATKIWATEPSIEFRGIEHAKTI